MKKCNSIPQLEESVMIKSGILYFFLRLNFIDFFHFLSQRMLENFIGSSYFLVSLEASVLVLYLNH